MPRSPATASPATRYMVSIQIARAWWEALARHTWPMTRAFPRSRERRDPLDHRLLLTRGERVIGLKKFRYIADYDTYLNGHGLPDTTIRPRPIVAAAMAATTSCNGAPLGRFIGVRNA